MLLLDTHTIVWLQAGDDMDHAAISHIDQLASIGGVLVSPISAWELGLLVSKSRLSLDLPPVAWFERVLALPGIKMVPLSATAAIGSSFLPEPFHKDVADRLLVATARELSVPIVTRDRKILAYAAAGHLQAIPC